MERFKTIMPAAYRRTHLQGYQIAIEDRVARGSDHWAVWLGAGAAFDDWIPFALARALKHELISQAIAGPIGTPVDCWVDNNRWIARCECGGQETVDPSEERFYCLSCYNLVNDHRARPINWPADWEDFEEVLSARPDPLNRNQAALQNPVTFAWVAMETVKDLESENVKHGLPKRRPKE